MKEILFLNRISLKAKEKEFTDIIPKVLGYEYNAPNHFFGPAVRDYYLIHFVFEGCGVLYKNGKAYPVKKGEMFLIKPQEVTKYVADSKNPWVYSWIGFSGKVAKIFDELDYPVKPILPYYFTEVKMMAEMGSVPYELVISLIFRLISELFVNNGVSQDYIEQVKNYVEINYMENISVEDIAKYVNLDRRYLGRIFKEKTNVSIKKYLTDYRLNKSIEFMQKGFNIKNSANMSGYSDTFNYSKIFKKTFGISPKQYKEQNK